MKANEVDTVVRAASPLKPKGGTRYDRLMEQADRTRMLRLFVPWAAPPKDGAKVLRPEEATIQWLAELSSSLGAVAAVETIVMPADTYAARSGFDMTRAGDYWRTVREMQRLAGLDSTLLPASKIEKDPRYVEYLARQAYAFERLPKPQRNKITDSAVKYSGLSDGEAYESAADYVMRRAAEADFVGNELNALWVSLNYPERDAMCGDTPRIYAPEDVRTPWLRER